MQIEDNDELARFREEWKEEVRVRSTRTGDLTTSHPPASTTKASQTDSSATKVVSPVDLYRSAVHAEEQGLLDEALALYRRAFRREPNVDKLYAREERAHASASAIKREHPIAPSPSQVDALLHQLQDINLQPTPGRSLELEAVLSAFPDELMFISQDEQSLSPLQSLPLEVIVDVLMQLVYRNDIRAVERFASVCRKARAVTLDPSIWRYLVKKTYVPPQIPEEGFREAIVKRFNEDYRRVYIEHPRLRLDGVYIAVCHYVRSGLSENAWVSVSHLITYHRFLRFLPDGTALSLLANEDENPQDVVHYLQPELQMKGFMRGRWHLDGSAVYITNLSNPNQPVAKYTFQMVLSLKSRPVGRWNKLDLLEYDSVAVETGEVSPFMLKHERPFWFSKVRSY